VRVVLENNARTWSWLLWIALLVTYAGHAAKVYHAATGRSYAVRLPDGFSVAASGDLHGNFPFLSTAKNAFAEEVVFNGQIDKVANGSGNATIRAFFRSSAATYEVIENRRAPLARSETISVNVVASTSEMKNGVYTVGACVADDEGVRVAWLNRFFEKIDGGPVEYVARPVSLTPAGASGGVQFMVEKIDKEKEGFVFEGWAVLDHAEMDEYNAYLSFEDSNAVSKAYYAPLFTRMDIAAMYEDVRAANCGFQVRIPPGEFAPGTYRIKVALESRKTGEVIESQQAEERAL